MPRTDFKGEGTLEMLTVLCLSFLYIIVQKYPLTFTRHGFKMVLHCQRL